MASGAAKAKLRAKKIAHRIILRKLPRGGDAKLDHEKIKVFIQLLRSDTIAGQFAGRCRYFIALAVPAGTP